MNKGPATRGLGFSSGASDAVGASQSAGQARRFGRAGRNATAAGGAAMTETETILVRLAVMENLCLATLTLYLGAVRNDPDFSKSTTMLDLIQKQIEKSLAHLPDDVRDHGTDLGKDLLDRVRRSLSAFHTRPSEPVD